MKKQQIILLGLFIIAVCVISLIPFSKEFVSTSSHQEGYTEQLTDSSKNLSTDPIKNNSDYISIINAALSEEEDKAKDKMVIYNVQGRISSLKTKNAATLMGEISNPNNLANPRLFLQYMNWFGSNCPIDSDVCPGLSK